MGFLSDYILMTPIPMKWKDWINEIVGDDDNGFSSMAEYIRGLIRADLIRRGKIQEEDNGR